MALVENIVSLENEADSIVAQARVEAKEIEQSAIVELEAYRRQLAEETEEKVSTFQRETGERHKHFIAEAEKELAQALDAVDQISGSVLREQMDRVITRFSEF